MKGFKSYQSPWVLVLLLIIGGLLGSIAGQLLGAQLPMFTKPLVVGINPPTTINLYVVSLTLGVTLKVSLATVVGFLLAYVIYRKL